MYTKKKLWNQNELIVCEIIVKQKLASSSFSSFYWCGILYSQLKTSTKFYDEEGDEE